MEHVKRVAIYARVSSSGQAKKDLSIPEQIRLVTEFCKQQGWRVAEVFQDKGKSGAETVNRPEFQRMIRAACTKAKPFDLILTRDQSRFGRSVHDAAVKAQLREHGVAIDNISNPTGDMHSDITPGGEMIEGIQSVVDIHARKTSTLQMIQGQKAKARKGGLSGSQATCYGYKQEWLSVGGAKPVRQPAIDKPKAKIVRELFRRYIAGDSLRRLTRWLNDSGVPAPRGKAWYETTVRKLLSNETLLGRLVHGRIRKAKHPVTRKPMNAINEGEVIRVDGAFPAIVDQKTFERVQRILDRNESTRPQGGHPGNTLRGIGKCAVCGSYLAHQSHSGTGEWYYFCGGVKTHGASKWNPACKGILQADYVDEVVELFLRRVLSTKVTDLREQVARYNEAATNLTGLSATETLDMAIAECEKRIDNVVAAIAKAPASAALLAKLEQDEAKLVALTRKRDTVLSTVAAEPVDVEPVLEARSKIKATLDRKDTARMRAILAAIVSEVRCDWSKRKSPAVNFSYLYEANREPIRFNVTHKESREWREAFPEVWEKSYKQILAAVKSAKRITDGTEAARGRYHSSITVKNAPLTFIPKWSITSAERAAEEAIAQIAEALA